MTTTTTTTTQTSATVGTASTIDKTNKTSSSLPQNNNYRYVRYNELYDLSSLQEDSLVWVLKGKRKGTNSGELFLRARVLDTNPPPLHPDKNNSNNLVLIRYPKGSTYHVKRHNLLPVVMQSHVVLVAPETKDYRRCAVVHTQPHDVFVEIGCDMGTTVHRVATMSQPQFVAGIDKANDSIKTCQRRYPQWPFWQVDIFTATNWEHHLPQTPTVVAIDINGNREQEAVLECLERVLQMWSPRLCVVKSRALYELVGPYSASC